jgi:hypothetical protein
MKKCMNYKVVALDEIYDCHITFIFTRVHTKGYDFPPAGWEGAAVSNGGSYSFAKHWEDVYLVSAVSIPRLLIFFFSLEFPSFVLEMIDSLFVGEAPQQMIRLGSPNN